MKKKLLAAMCCLFASTLTMKAQNYSIQLNGTDEAVDLQGVVGDGVRTVEMWFRPAVNIPSGLTTLATLIARNTNDSPTADEWGIYFDNVSGRMIFFIRNGTAYQFTQTTTASWIAGTWYHVTAVSGPTIGGMAIYINGTLDGTINTAFSGATSSRTEDTRIGCWGDAAIRFFNGRIENTRLWSRELTTTEITNFQCNTPNDYTNLLGEYLFNEESGTVATNETGINNGTYINAPTWVIDCPCGISMQFDGVDDNVNLSDFVGDGVRAIEMWFQPLVNITNANATPITLIARNTLGETDEFGLYFSTTGWGNAGQLAFFARNGTALNTVFSGAAMNNWTAGTWYHVVATIDDAAGSVTGSPGLNLYVDGTFLFNNAGHTTATGASTDDLYIACWGDDFSRYFNGRIENLRLWGRTLSDAEAMNHMCNVPTNYTDIIAEYRFNEHHGPVIYDQSTVNHRNGTVNGAIWVDERPNCNPLDKLAGEFIGTMKQPGTLMVYPNPGNGIFTIDAGERPTGDDFTLEIYNSMGSLVKTQNASGGVIQVDISECESGVYFVKLNTANEVICGRVIKK